MNRPSTCLLGSGSVLGWLQVGVPHVEALENPSQVQDEIPGRQLARARPSVGPSG